jgi:hypothetical protein
MSTVGVSAKPKSTGLKPVVALVDPGPVAASDKRRMHELAFNNTTD